MERINYYNKNIKFNRRALKEVWEILNEYEEGISEIPEKYLWVIEDNMDNDYIFVIDDLETANLREDTKKIITYLYTNFLSTPEERDVLKKLELVHYKEKINKQNNQKQEIQSQLFNENKIEEKIEIDNEDIKENQNFVEETNDLQNNLPMEYKNSILKNILSKIKEIFKIK